MLKKLTLTLIMLGISLCTYSATFIISGVTIKHKWLSDSTWIISVELLSNCNVTNLFGAGNLCFRDTCGNVGSVSAGSTIYKTSFLEDGRPNGSPILHPCPNFMTNCDSFLANNVTSYKTYLLQDTVTLSGKCGRWSISFRSSTTVPKRDTFITNIEDNHWYYVETVVNYSDTSINNNSAVRIYKDPIYAPLNTPTNFSLKATDIDGDSLVYHLVSTNERLFSCANSPITNIPFIPPYTLAEPFNTGGTFVWDSVNAIISFTAPVVQNPLITLVIDEYRNGTWVGSSMHDIPIVIVPYSYPLPQHSSLPASWQQTQMLGVDSFYTCAGNAMSFATMFHSSDSNAQLQCNSNVATAIAGASLSYNNLYTDSVKAILNWSPTINDTGWHSFTVTVKDTLCPIQGINSPQTFALRIYVHPPAGAVTYLNVTACGNYIWNGQSYTLSGMYTQTFTNINGCDSLVTLNLNTFYIDTTVLHTGFTMISNQPIAISYQWINCDSNIPIAGATNVSYSTFIGGTYAVIINTGTCIDTSECITTFSMNTNNYIASNKIKISPNPASNKLYIQCLGQNVCTNKILMVYNMLGQLVNKIVLPDEQNFVLDIDEWQAGVYSLQFFADNELISINKLSILK